MSWVRLVAVLDFNENHRVRSRSKGSEGYTHAMKTFRGNCKTPCVSVVTKRVPLSLGFLCG